jgi:hypothetical protein
LAFDLKLDANDLKGLGNGYLALSVEDTARVDF